MLFPRNAQIIALVLGFSLLTNLQSVRAQTSKPATPPKPAATAQQKPDDKKPDDKKPDDKKPAPPSIDKTDK